MLRKLVRFICCKLLFKVKYYNSNLESNIGSCVVCSNHMSAWDPFFLYADSANLSIMAKAELFKFKPLGYILKKIGVFPINRGEKDAKSIMHAVNLLKDNEGGKLLIFPEGTRVKSGVRIPGKIGAVYVSLKANVPILPVRIIKEKPSRKIFTRISVVYGNPVIFNGAGIKDKEYLKKSTNELLDNIYNLNIPQSLNSGEKDKKNGTKKTKIRIEKT